jgi:hypothetical protein
MPRMLLLRDPADAGQVTICRCRIRDRLRARVRAFELDRALARGAPPDSSAALVWRAQALLRRRKRRELGDQIRRIVQSAREPSRALGVGVPISRRLLLAVEPELSLLAVRLLDDEPVEVQGIASSAVLLSDGLGPLYGHGSAAAEELRAAASRAIDTLEPHY